MLSMADLWQGLTGQKLDPSLGEGVEFTTVVVDSRQAEKGSIFFALLGEKGDGHDYAHDAFGRGAKAAFVNREVPGCSAIIRPPNDPAPALATALEGPWCIIVPDTLQALQDLARFWRRKFEIRVIGVTGSTGKTSTKESIYSVLKRSFKTLKSPGNYNNEIGLPLTILEMDGTQEKAVLEMGMYHLGEIRTLAEISLPVVGLVTNIGPSHLERLGSMEAIARAKAELVEALPKDGVALLNGDDQRVREMATKTQAQVLFYGLAEDCSFRATEIESRGMEGIRFRLHYRGESFFVKVPLLGRHSVHTALAAVAVGTIEGQAWDDILAGLQEISAQLRLITYPGINGATVIDDTYNANPDSMLAALNLLAELEGRKIAVLGDMLELGGFEIPGHKLVGRRAQEVADFLVTVGPRARMMAEEAIEQDKVSAVENNAQALEILRERLQPGDVVLVKGSRAMKMEEIVSQIISRPSRE
ncbi:MAG: UDP-N-acetylmuramoyl-tripeptide--D-alanyl-D-alanine ligase [Chloroflexi bacterium]|nr:UDP-N-acetylmuramoyl-tripeptide--D-alanyl-D-alanine ligase [Chloroflexota bacterium]